MRRRQTNAAHRRGPRSVALLIALAVVSTSCGTFFPSDEPTDTNTEARVVGRDWITSTPTRAGFEGPALADIIQDLRAEDSNVHRIVAAKDGRLGLDANLYPAPSRGRQAVGSITTSVVALVALAAIERGDVESLDTPLGDLLDLPAGSASAEISLQDLLGMRAGLDCSGREQEPQLAAMLASTDYVAAAAAIERAERPGRTFAYCAPAYHLVSAALGATTGRSLADYADEVLFDPLSIDSWIWPADEQGVTLGWSGLELDPPDLARIAQLVLDDGIVNDRRVIPAGLVPMLREDAIKAGPRREYALGWWLPEPIGDTRPIEATSRGGQSLLIDDEQGFLSLVMGAAAEGTALNRRLASATLLRPIPDLASDKTIGEALNDLSLPPEAAPGTSPGVSARLGTTFGLQPNRFGFQSMTITADNGLQVLMAIDDKLRYLPIPLDGIPRVVQLSATQRLAALSGRWEGDALVVDHEAIHDAQHLVLEFDIGPDPFLRVTDLNSDRPPLRIGVA